MQIRRFRGSRTVMSFRLCSRAPWTTSSSAAMRRPIVSGERVFCLGADEGCSECRGGCGGDGERDPFDVAVEQHACDHGERAGCEERVDDAEETAVVGAAAA